MKTFKKINDDKNSISEDEEVLSLKSMNSGNEIDEYMDYDEYENTDDQQAIYEENDSYEGNILKDLVEEEQSENLEDNHDWGTRKENYYDHDFKDGDYLVHDADAGLIAEIEETEAINMQKRLTKLIDESKNLLSRKDISLNKVLIDGNLQSSMEESDRFKVISYRYSNLLETIKKLKKKDEELEKINIDLKKYSNDTEIDSQIVHKTMKLLNLKKVLIKCYKANIYFLVSLAMHNLSTDDHPVTIALSNYESIYEDIESFEIRLLNEWKLNPSANEYTTQDENELNFEKNEQSDEIVRNDEEDIDSKPKKNNSKRSVTKEIIVNRGLARFTKKTRRNPRIKNKLRFKNTIKRYREKVRAVKSKEVAYVGEKTGISKSVIHSIKFK